MKLTKFQHACFVIENENNSVIIDPGSFTHDLIIPAKLTAIVVTHGHPDHCDPVLIARLLQDNPKITLIAHESITTKFTGSAVQAVTANEIVRIGHIELKFVGGAHETIAENITIPPNLGVIINSQLYYPGDSFFIPEQPIKVLALPVSAPWLKFSESLNFMNTIKPQFAFPTHDQILSSDGQMLTDRLFENAAKNNGITYERINGTTIEIV